MKTVFLYAGQGSQKVGMGKDFYDEYEEYRELIDSFNIDIDIDLKKLMHEGPIEDLSKTENTQPSMSAFAAGVTLLLKNAGIKPDACCGLSLGEYSALHCAGAMDANALVSLTAFRGKKMAEAAKGYNCSMSAILGTDAKTVEEACEAYNGDGYVTVANYNCPGQYVICGDEDAVLAVENALKEKGVKRAVRLNVSGPFHTKYMKAAGDALEKYFEEMKLDEIDIPITLNYTGEFYKPGDDIKKNLVMQVQNSVKMEEDLRKLISSGAKRFIEIGPGNALSGFLKKTAKEMNVSDIEIINISTVEDFKKVSNEN